MNFQTKQISTESKKGGNLRFRKIAIFKMTSQFSCRLSYMHVISVSTNYSLNPKCELFASASSAYSYRMHHNDQSVQATVFKSVSYFFLANKIKRHNIQLKW